MKHFGILCIRCWLTGEGKLKEQDSHMGGLFLGCCGHLLIRVIDFGGFQSVEIGASKLHARLVFLRSGPSRKEGFV